ncbi:MAG: OmpH family outer membrane protein [Sphingobacteriales bacterium]|nr:MAG: OmpH family outer membrane protein [Sphingobacteriales bacterium]
MKNLSLALSVLAFVGVLVLFGMRLSGDKGRNASGTSAATPRSASGDGGSRIAYVDIDTLEANYDFLKNKKSEFTKRQQNMKAELERSAQQMQNDVVNLQRKAQSGAMSEAEMKSAEKRVIQMQQSLQAREATLTQQLMEEQEQFNKDLQTRLDQFLEEYNKDKRYDYILSYSRSGSILYADKSLDITADVLKGMNAMSKDIKDDAKKK